MCCAGKWLAERAFVMWAQLCSFFLFEWNVRPESE